MKVLKGMRKVFAAQPRARGHVGASCPDAGGSDELFEMTSVPKDARQRALFGKSATQGGYSIDNRDTLIDEIATQTEERLGLPKADLKALVGAVHGGNPFSHAIAGYRKDADPGKVDIEIANIWGLPGKPLVNLMRAGEYFFGVGRFKSGNPQRGFIFREGAFTLLYAGHIDADAMRAKAEEMRASNENARTRFFIYPRPMNVTKRFYERLTGKEAREWVNCSRGNAQMERAGNVVDQTSMYPNRNLELAIQQNWGQEVVFEVVPAKKSSRSEGKPVTTPLRMVGHEPASAAFDPSKVAHGRIEVREENGEFHATVVWNEERVAQYREVVAQRRAEAAAAAPAESANG